MRITLALTLVLAGAMLMSGGCDSDRTGVTDPGLEREKAAAELGDLTRPQVVVLENGMTVLLQKDDRFPLVSTRLYVRAGSRYEDPGQAGISHLLEHMVFKATHKRAQGEVAREIEGAGGELNAATSFDYTMYYNTLPADKWATGMEVIRDMIFGAKFDPEELESERQVVLSEIRRGKDNPQRMMFQTMQKLVWKNLPYARPVIGFPETVGSITSKDLKEYVARMYQPRSMLLVVVGDMEPSRVLGEARRHFGSREGDRAMVRHTPRDVSQWEPPQAFVVEEGDWNKVYMSAAFPLPGLVDARIPGLEVLAHMLGGDRTSLLYRRFKYQEQLVDDISASAMSMELGGALVVQATLDAENYDEFWAGLTGELAGLAAGSFTAEEIKRAKLNIEDSLFQAKETLSGLAAKLGYFQFFENGPESEDNYLVDLANVDSRQVGELVDTYIDPSRLCVSAVAPRGSGIEREAMHQAATAAWPERADKPEAEEAGPPTEPATVDLGLGRWLVLLPDNTLPYTALSLTFRGGDGLLKISEQGLASLSARAMTRSTGDMDAPAIREYLSDRAASISAGAGRETFSVHAKYPRRFADEVEDLFAGIVTAPAWDPAEVRRAVDEQMARIQVQKDQPVGYAFRELFPFLFEGGGYGLYHNGTPESLAGFGPDEVRRFWDRQSAQPFVLAACGSFDPERVTALARELAAGLEPEIPDPMAFASPQWNTGERELGLTLENREQTHLFMVFPTTGMQDPDTPGLELLQNVLAGQSGLLFEELRDKKGLGYSVTAFNWQSPKTGFMVFYIGTQAEEAQEALQGFRDIAARLRDHNLPPDRIERAKSLLLGDYYRDHQSLLSRSREAAGYMAQGFTRDWGREMIDRARELEAKDLLDLARKYLDPEAAYLVTVEP